jgi:sulfur carrier protein
MKITVNGEAREVTDLTPIADIVRQLGAEPDATAVACNGEIVPRSTWHETTISSGDSLEIVSAAPGG